MRLLANRESDVCSTIFISELHESSRSGHDYDRIAGVDNTHPVGYYVSDIMSLSYHFSFKAPATVSADDLESFLKGVERYAKSVGFGPTTVLNVAFDSQERSDFARRLGGGVYIESEKLKGQFQPSPEDASNHIQASGSCRLVPRRGVVLVVTDEQGRETCFGFMKFPPSVRDINGRVLADTGLGDSWAYRDFVDTPDKRYRQIVKRFADAGYLAEEKDEYVKSA